MPGELVLALNGVPVSVSPEDARAVVLERNLGVAPGWNAAAAAARGDILVFGNDDLLPGPGSLAALARALDGSEHVGIVGVNSWDRTAQASTVGATGQLRACEALRGPLFALRAETFAAVGGFDEAYAPCCWEEVDLSLAIRHRLGLGSYVADVPFDHEPGISARRSLPWVRVAYAGRSESLWSIRRRNRRRLTEKWGV
jgi:GT2 family glycosyltransferase